MTESRLPYGPRLWRMACPSLDAGSIHLPPPPPLISGELSWPCRMPNTARPSRPSHPTAWLYIPSSEVISEMLNKHPQAPSPSLPTDPLPSSTKLPVSAIMRGVKSFPCGSAPGPSGLRPSHLREAVGCPSPDRANSVLLSLTRFTNLLAAGQSPSFVLPHLCGASLFAVRKKCGGFRPIAVGEVLRRLTSKCLANAARHSAFSSLTPHLMSFSSINQRWTLLLDFSKAFNCINREAMFAEIRHRIPSLSAWMDSCYACQPFLLLRTDSIRSCVGVQQGDPLGPLGFALTLHPLIEKIRAEVPGLFLNAWYLDDGTLMGSPEDLATALRIEERDSPSLGLHLNRGKSLLFIPENVDASLSPLPPDIPITRRGFSLLGCPIGLPDFCEDVFQARLVKLKVSLGALRDMGDSQLETTLSLSHTHTHTLIHTHTHTRTHTYTHTHTLIHTHARTHTRTHTHTHAQTYANIHTHTHAHTHMQTYTHTRAHAHIHTHTHTHANIHAHTHTHAQTYANTHTHTHARTHTHTPF